MKQVQFTQMKDGTAAEYRFLQNLEQTYIKTLPDRLQTALLALEGSLQGYAVSRLEHSLQSATRAEADGADVDYIIAALLHDIGDELAPDNHAQMAASIVRPYVRSEVTWVISMHGLFQMRYYARQLDLDPNGYLQYQNHPWFEACCNFCERWDQAAFDPEYPSKPLSYFMPMLRQVLARKAFDPAVLQTPDWAVHNNTNIRHHT